MLRETKEGDNEGSQFRSVRKEDMKNLEMLPAALLRVVVVCVMFF